MKTINFKKEWFTNPNIFINIISGVLVGFALIPEAVSFSIVAGLDPMVGLYAAVIMAISISIAGGRTAMISGTTAAMALVVIDLVQSHGAEYLFIATILMGVIQMILGWLKIGRLLRFIPNSVMIGFMDALAIMLFTTQMQHIIGISRDTYFYAVITFLIIFFVPRFYTKIPSPLIGLLSMTAVYFIIGGDVKTVSDLGHIKRSLPVFSIPDVPYNFETLKIIFPHSVSMALVGLIQSLIVARILDNYTGTRSNKNRESFGQGVANLFTGFFGGMAGCAMTGQSVINVQNGARARISTFTAGAFLLFLIVVLGDVVNQVPMPVLAGLMVYIAYNTFDWRTFKYVRQAPKADISVMIVTIVVGIITNNLALGTVTGITVAILTFAVKVSKITVTKTKESEYHVTYLVAGQLFFASIESMLEQLDYDNNEDIITLDFKNATLWDSTAVNAIQTAILNFEQRGKAVNIINLNSNSTHIVERMTRIKIDNKRG